jgi:hypothetical protein
VVVTGSVTTGASFGADAPVNAGAEAESSSSLHPTTVVAVRATAAAVRIHVARIVISLSEHPTAARPRGIVWWSGDVD